MLNYIYYHNIYVYCILYRNLVFTHIGILYLYSMNVICNRSKKCVRLICHLQSWNKMTSLSIFFHSKIYEESCKHV